jgi:hypothetical protein
MTVLTLSTTASVHPFGLKYNINILSRIFSFLLHIRVFGVNFINVKFQTR